MVSCPASDVAQIPAFYAGQSVLITGATGFMGKVLIERLLSTCPDIGRLYLLMRMKKDVPAAKRLATLKQSAVFDNLRTKNPHQLDKLRLVVGDTSRPHLGIVREQLEQLNEVSLVFHVAATLKFDEELTLAVDQNVRAATRLMDILDDLPNIKAFMHVSTAYCNAEKTEIEERVYPPPIAADQLCSLVDSLPASAAPEVTKHLLGDKPNTYTFTKAVAEAAVAERGASYPVAIFRPSIVISSVKNPYPGWIENLNGPSGVVVGAGKGLLHTFRCQRSAIADLMPVDVCIDTLIAVGWQTAASRPGSVRVYNCVAGRAGVPWGTFEVSLRKHILGTPFDNAFWYPTGHACETQLAYKFHEWTLQTIPLYVAAYIAQLFGIKTKISLITASKKLSAMNEVLTFFTTHEWRFSNDNVRALHAAMSEKDREIYQLDLSGIDWDNHFKNFVLGTRRYLLKEKDQDLDEARKHLRRMFYVHNFVKLASFVGTTRLLLNYFPVLRTAVYGTLRLLLSLFNTAYRKILMPS